jgi:hypothetical protein
VFLKLEIRAEQFLPGSEGVVGEGREITQILYAHMKKQTNKQKNVFLDWLPLKALDVKSPATS